jgi:bifunctional enzyme CysN/CysC
MFGTIWLTGLSGSGKSALAIALLKRFDEDVSIITLDGDGLRAGVNSDLGYDEEDRREAIRRTGEIAALLAEQGHVCIASLVSPYEDAREDIKELHEDLGLPFTLVHVATPLSVCQQRDVKGLYAELGADIADSPYETPMTPDVVVFGTEPTSLVDNARLVYSRFALDYYKTCNGGHKRPSI